jgi:hypothetical protein
MVGGPAEGSPVPAPNEPERPRLSTKQYIIGGAVAVVLLIAIFLLVRYQNGRERRRYEAILTVTLDRLVTAQEGFFYDSTRYTTSLTALRGVQLPAGVHVQIQMKPDRRSWWGTASHDRLPDSYCMVWVGTPPSAVPPELRAPEDETKPFCFPNAYFIMQRSSRS